MDRNLRHKRGVPVPGRQVGDGGGGGAWEEFDCDEALSDPERRLGEASSIHWATLPSKEAKER